MAAVSGKDGKVCEKTVTIKIPGDLYAKLVELATESDSTPTDQVASLIEAALKHRAWLRELNELRELIKKENPQETEQDHEEFIEQLRKTRREIFEAEYAHLYR